MGMIRIAKLAVRAAAAAFCLAVLAMAPVRAHGVLPAYLEELIDDSAIAFQGTCTGNRSERDAQTNYIVTYTTFTVHEVLKGGVGTTYEIKQIGGTLPDGSMRYRVEGVPTFNVGEDYVVFLAGVSPIGFSSPIALGQGAFKVRAQGAAKVVANGRDFREMMSRMNATLPPAARAQLQAIGPVREWDLDDFKRIVRAHLAGAQ